jgi:phosphate uptake regulator
MLKRLIRAIEAKGDAELAKNVAQLKTEVDALSWPILRSCQA